MSTAIKNKAEVCFLFFFFPSKEKVKDRTVCSRLHKNMQKTRNGFFLANVSG